MLPKNWLKFLLIAIVTILILLPQSLWGQTKEAENPISLVNFTDKAPIMVDGRTIFEVGSIRRYSAEQRADIINQALVDQVRLRHPVRLEIAREAKQIVIRNRDTEQHLLTVTDADVISAASAWKQAANWRSQLERAIAVGQKERTSSYRQRASFISLALIIGGLLLQIGVICFYRFFYRRLLTRLENRSSSLYAWRSPIKAGLRIFQLFFSPILWLVLCFSIIHLFPNSRTIVYRLFQVLNKPIVSLGEKSYSALEFLWLAALTVGLWFFVRAITQLFRSYILQPTGASQSLQEVVAIITQYILTFFGLIILWQIWGLDLGALTILASVLGVGIGFGLQNIANNFLSGLIITIERPIQVGDFVEVGDLVGTVQRIGARSTYIRTQKQVSIIVPNSRFLETEVINWNHGDPLSRISIPIGIAYGSKIQKVRGALLSAAQSHPEVVIAPRPKVLLSKFGDNALHFNLWVWIKEPKLQERIKSDLNYRIECNLRRAGIGIPFPQRDLHLQSPQLDRMLMALLLKQGLTQEEIQALQSPTAEANGNEGDIEMDWEDWSTPLDERFSQTELEAMADKMRGSQGLDIQSRRYRLNVYPKCFVGSEAVVWIQNNYDCSREEAIELGQILVERRIIHHVTDQHPFEDNFLFYRFYADESIGES